MKKFRILLIALAFTSPLIISSCEEDKDPGAPELPPVESLTVDFSDFNDPTDTLNIRKSAYEGTITYRNWGTAFLNVAFWNSFVTVSMAVPVVSYVEALKHDPEYLGDNKWQWSFSHKINNIDYSARLVAYRVSNEEYKAEMYISRGNVYSDFKWFEGTIRYDRTHAIWTMYESPVAAHELLEIEWNRDWEAGSGDINYTMIKNGAPEEGSYMNFSIDPTADMQASYTVKTSTNMVMIEWNRDSRAGHISDPNAFGDEAWHCWNENLQDIDCP